jgi:hypothetical protein
VTAPRLSLVQRLARTLLPARAFAAMERESREWMLECSGCGHRRSLWEMGGIRYKASGTPRMRGSCARCGTSGWHPIVRDRAA